MSGVSQLTLRDKGDPPPKCGHQKPNHRWERPKWPRHQPTPEKMYRSVAVRALLGAGPYSSIAFQEVESLHTSHRRYMTAIGEDDRYALNWLFNPFVWYVCMSE